MSNLTVNNFKAAFSKSQQLPFRNLQSRGFRLVLDEKKEPVRLFGSSSVVFKITDGTHFYALKCFTTDLFNRWDYLQKVQAKLEELQKDWIAPFEIYENEIQVENDEGQKISCTIILMPWLEGERLINLVKLYSSRQSLNGKLKNLSQALVTLAKKHLDQPFSHGDITPENIIVEPSGKMTLIDHDSFTFEGWNSSVGQGGWSFPYQHPHRNPRKPDLKADHFSFLLLAASLKALELNPDLFEQFNSSKGLLFSIDDYKHPEQSSLLKEMKKIDDSHFQSLLKLLLAQLKENSTAIPGLINYLDRSSMGQMNMQPAELMSTELSASKENYNYSFFPKLPSKKKTGNADLPNIPENNFEQEQLEKEQLLKEAHRQEQLRLLELQKAEQVKAELERENLLKEAHRHEEMQLAEQQKAEQHRIEHQIEEARRQEEMRLVEQQKAEQQRIEQQREEARRQEEMRLAEQQKAEQQRIEQEREEAHRQEEMRLAEQQKAEQQRIEQEREEARRQEEMRLAELQKAEQQRIEQEREEARRQEEMRLAEQQKAEQQRIEQEREEARHQEEMRLAEQQKAKEEREKLREYELQREEQQKAELERIGVMQKEQHNGQRHSDVMEGENIQETEQVIDNTNPAYQRRRIRIRNGVLATLATILLVVLGIKMFFPGTKIVKPVDYKKLVTNPQNTTSDTQSLSKTTEENTVTLNNTITANDSNAITSLEKNNGETGTINDQKTNAGVATNDINQNATEPSTNESVSSPSNNIPVGETKTIDGKVNSLATTPPHENKSVINYRTKNSLNKPGKQKKITFRKTGF